MENRNWWERNWKWLVPVGCLTVVLLFVAGFALVITFVFGMMKQSSAYSEALEIARADPAVVAALGTPIEDGFMVSGNISENGPSGRAELSIPVSGPRGTATIYVEADKSAGAWKFKTLIAELDAGNERIDLLASTPATGDAPAQ